MRSPLAVWARSTHNAAIRRRRAPCQGLEYEAIHGEALTALLNPCG